MLNPATAGTDGKLNMEAHAFAVSVITGAEGKITTLTVLLAPHAPGPWVVGVVDPQSVVTTYRALTVWQPGVVVLGEDEYAPPSILYSTLNPVTAVTVGKTNIAAQVFAGAVITGAVGKTTALIVLSWQPAIELTEFAGVEPQADVSLYLAFIVQQPFVLLSKRFAAVKVPYALNAPPGA